MFTHGQWWSNLATHLSHDEQCLERRGRRTWGCGFVRYEGRRGRIMGNMKVGVKVGVVGYEGRGAI